MTTLSTFPVIVLLLSLLNVGMVHAASDNAGAGATNESISGVVLSNIEPVNASAFENALDDANANTSAAADSSPCPKGMFHCGDLFDTCIDKDDVCDGQVNCPETGADELGCSLDTLLPDSEEFLSASYLFCKDNEFRCSSDGKCISKVKLCDGVRDCSGGEDEGGQCGECEAHSCEYKCQDSPHGPQCYCPNNLDLQVDGRSCALVSFCDKHGHRCAQFCENNPDRLVCRCAAGYTLKNEIECVPNDQFRNGYLYYTQGDRSIHRVPLFKNASEKDVPEEVVAPRPSAEKISSIAFSPRGRNVYFSVNEHRNTKIMLWNSSKPGHETAIYEGHGIKHLAYDWISDNIYYAADGLGIGVCSANGRFCSHLITGRAYHENERPQTYGNLLVHPKMGIMIWVDFNRDHPDGIIMKAELDGKEITALTSIAARPILMTSLDYVRDELYILEGEEMSVLNLHTLRRRPFSNQIHPWAMIPFAGRLHYIARENTDLMVSAGKSGEARVPSLKGSQFSMAIENELYHDSISNPCEKLKCSHLCVLQRPNLKKPLEAKCICPDKYTMVNGSCIFDRDIDGPVRTAAAQMDEWCDRGDACPRRGSCKAGGYEHQKHQQTPACECLPEHSGLYCEIHPAKTLMQKVTSGRGLTVLFILLFGSLLIPLSIYLVRTNPDYIHRIRYALGLHPSRSKPIIPTFVATPNRGGAQHQNDALLISTD